MNISWTSYFILTILNTKVTKFSSIRYVNISLNFLFDYIPNFNTLTQRYISLYSNLYEDAYFMMVLPSIPR